ncbi:hypothetical protein B0H13DRAFT_1864275 [Mycena leptocephala]|nr:hypothetical protein B0H13DRAFT_1864275 [Mycena leptocephala]
MGYIVKTSSIYRKLVSRKEAVLWYHVVTENGSSGLNGVADFVAGQRRRRRWKWRWKWGIGVNWNEERTEEEEETRRRTEREEEEESSRGKSAVNGEVYPNFVSAADRTPSPLGQLRCVHAMCELRLHYICEFPTTFNIQLRNTIPVVGFPVSLITGVHLFIIFSSGPSSGWFIQFVPRDDQDGNPSFSRSEEFSIDTTIGGTQSVTVHAVVVTALSSNLMQQPDFTAIIRMLDVVCINVATTCIILILYAGLSYCIPTHHCNENNLSGPIAGAVVGGLIVVLAVVGLFIYRARHRRQKAPPSPRGKSYDTGGAHFFPTRGLPRVLAMQEKARYAARLEQEIRDLTEQVEAPGAGQPEHTNAQLLEEIRVLRTQMRPSSSNLNRCKRR